MPFLAYKLIDESIERHKNYRRKNGCSEGMLALRRFIKGNHHYNNESLLKAVKARRVLYPALEVRETSDPNRECN